LDTGHLDNRFYFDTNEYLLSVDGRSGPAIGGGVWNAPASDGQGLYFTTGNTRQWDPGVYPSEYPGDARPTINRGLGLLRLDRFTGAVRWIFQPVPIALDNDPDWNAGATVMNTDCGDIIASVMKDGWSYAVDRAHGSCLWQFPDLGNPGCVFPATDTHEHANPGFYAPGAAWGNVLIIGTGGYTLLRGNLSGKVGIYSWLHALDVCATSARGTKPRVRWIANVPGSSSQVGALGAPTITFGIVYIGTDQGHVIALADPSVAGNDEYVCDEPDLVSSGFGLQDVCGAAGGVAVPVPRVLVDVVLDDHGNAARLRKEVVIAEGMALISTSRGHLYALGVTAPQSWPSRERPSGYGAVQRQLWQGPRPGESSQNHDTNTGQKVCYNTCGTPAAP
jgi:hypothetical protein